MADETYGRHHVRLNARMRALLAETSSTADKLDSELTAILDEGFELVQGCVVLSSFAESARRGSVASLRDETGYEGFINHIHIERSLDDVTAPNVFGQALLFVDRLARELEHAFPDDAFNVIVTLNDSCIVRFHLVRPSQPGLLLADLESYEEAVMVLRVPAGRDV